MKSGTILMYNCTGEKYFKMKQIFSMLVFCGVNSALCNQVLEVLRTANVPQVDLKAILTQENQTWDSLKLYEELKKERESFQQEQEKAQD